MKTFKFSPESAASPANWETSGKSPGNTPMAKLQAAQMLLQASQDPRAGIDVHELVSTLIANGPLANAKNIQFTKEEIAEQQQQQMQQQMLMQQMQTPPGAGAGPDGQMVGGPGGPNLPGVPPGMAGPGAGEMPFPGPGGPPVGAMPFPGA